MSFLLENYLFCRENIPFWTVLEYICSLVEIETTFTGPKKSQSRQPHEFLVRCKLAVALPLSEKSCLFPPAIAIDQQ